MTLKKYLSIGWNWVYFMCGALGTQWVGLLKNQNFIQGILYCLLISIGKETCDELTSRTSWSGRFGFDAAGFDYRDLIMTVLGGMFTITVNLILSYFHVLKTIYSPI